MTVVSPENAARAPVCQILRPQREPCIVWPAASSAARLVEAKLGGRDRHAPGAQQLRLVRLRGPMMAPTATESDCAP